MEKSINTEVLFTEVAEAYSTAGKQMDAWTTTRYQDLMKHFTTEGSLTEKQIDLLSKLKMYIAKSPSLKSTPTPIPAKKSVKETFSKIITDSQPKVGKSNHEIFCSTFENKVAIEGHMPTENELFEYYWNKRQSGSGIKIPNQFAIKFAEWGVYRNKK